MITADPITLVRILVDDPDQIKEAENARRIALIAIRVYVPQLTQIESIGILERDYKLSKNEILPVLKHLAHNTAFIIEDLDTFREAIRVYELTDSSFADCMVVTNFSQKEVKEYKNDLFPSD
jgi:predicted nucleic-acid-binding protein